MTTALVLHPDGEITEINLGADSLAAKYKAIGCRLVDVVALTSRLDMWLDEEGMYTQQINPAATALARRFGFVWQDYYGPVVLCSVTPEGDSVDLTREQLVGLLTALGDVAESL